MRLMGLRLMLLLLILAGGVGAYYVVGIPLQQAQEAAVNRFGSDVFNQCQNATKVRSGSLPSNIKIGVINSDKKTVYDTYDQALPDELRATDKSDLTVLLCLTERKTVFATDQYGKPAQYTCTRYARDLTGYLVDIKTGKTIDFLTFDGQEPPECPDETDSNISRIGDTPLPSQINAWLTRSMRSNNA